MAFCCLCAHVLGHTHRRAFLCSRSYDEMTLSFSLSYDVIVKAFAAMRFTFLYFTSCVLLVFLFFILYCYEESGAQIAAHLFVSRALP